MSTQKRKSKKEDETAKDIVYGYCKQHHRNVPLVLSNIILKRFDYTYFVNDSLKIKDILLPKFNFIESIINDIQSYLEFNSCQTCPTITWSDHFTLTICRKTPFSFVDHKARRCPNCLETFPYFKCISNYCNEELGFCEDCYIKAKKYKWKDECDSCGNQHCWDCVGWSLQDRQCTLCRKSFGFHCDDHDHDCIEKVIEKLRKECYECCKSLEYVYCDDCLFKENGVLVSRFDDEFYPIDQEILCKECFRYLEYAFCDLCKKIFKKDEMINERMINVNEGLLCVDCDSMKSVQEFNDIEFP